MNIYESITNRVVEALENGTKPWKKPWVCSSLAYNTISKRNYSLLNQMLLKHSGEYATFSQWTDLGCHIKHGEVGERIVFWKHLVVQDKKNPDLLKDIPMLKYYIVFHSSQLEYYCARKSKIVDEEYPDAQTVFDRYISAEKIPVEFGGNKACYSVETDSIRLPKRTDFRSAGDFFSTAFHEAVHSTGSADRLNRNLVSFVDDVDAYSKEELIAEIGSSVLLATLGIYDKKVKTNSISYLANWAAALRADKHLIVRATSKAEQAVKYILNKKIIVKGFGA